MTTGPSFSAVVQPRRPRLSDTIAEQIEGLIANGALKPGDSLPPERDLSKQLDVSRPSLREALLVLESRGLLQVRRGGGYCVTDVTGPVITDPLVHAHQQVARAKRSTTSRTTSGCSTNSMRRSSRRSLRGIRLQRERRRTCT